MIEFAAISLFDWLPPAVVGAPFSTSDLLTTLNDENE